MIEGRLDDIVSDRDSYEIEQKNPREARAYSTVHRRKLFLLVVRHTDRVGIPVKLLDATLCSFTRPILATSHFHHN